MSKYSEFIRSMQEKYMGVMGGQGLDGVALTAVAPSGLMDRGNNGGRQITVPAGEGAGTGSRFMSRSDAAVRQADKPAGIVEEDEMVVEAPMVDKIGGPGRVREGLEVLADMKKKGVARSFATGTGDQTAGNTDQAYADWKKKVNYSESQHGTDVSLRPVFDEWSGKYGTSGKTFDTNVGRQDWEKTYGTGSAPVQSTTLPGGTTANPPTYTPETPDSLGLPKAPELKSAADVTKGMTDRGVSRFADTTDKAMEDIKKLSTGGSEAMKTVSDVATRGMAGQQAARSSSLDQNLAQQGVEGGAARVAQAMESRQAGTEQTKLRSDLAIENQQRMERATSQLASFGLQGEQLEEAKHQFDVGVQKWGTEFEEASKQWGANFSQRQAEFTTTANQWGKEYAFAREKFDYGKVQDNISAAFKAGDFDTVSNLYKGLGVTIDMTNLKDQAAFDKLTRDMQNFTDLTTSFGPNSSQARGALDVMYKTQHPEQYDDKGVLKPEFKDSHDSQIKMDIENHAIMKSPTRSVIEAVPEQQIYDMASLWMGKDINKDNINDFTFNGVKGADAVKNVMALVADTPNALDDPDSPISKLISGKPATIKGPDGKPLTGADATEALLFDTPTFKNSKPGEVLTDPKNPNRIYANIGGTFKQVTNTITESSDFGTSAKSGDIINFDGANIKETRYGVTIPRGPYKVETMTVEGHDVRVYKSVTDPNMIYLADKMDYNGGRSGGTYWNNTLENAGIKAGGKSR